MCCGNQRQPVSAPAPQAVPREAGTAQPRPQPGPAPGATFEYRGSTALTVVSPITARKYRFDHPGAKSVVDSRDIPWLTFVPHLRRA